MKTSFISSLRKTSLEVSNVYVAVNKLKLKNRLLKFAFSLPNYHRNTWFYSDCRQDDS